MVEISIISVQTLNISVHISNISVELSMTSIKIPKILGEISTSFVLENGWAMSTNLWFWQQILWDLEQNIWIFDKNIPHFDRNHTCSQNTIHTFRSINQICWYKSQWYLSKSQKFRAKSQLNWSKWRILAFRDLNRNHR